MPDDQSNGSSSAPLQFRPPSGAYRVGRVRCRACDPARIGHTILETCDVADCPTVVRGVFSEGHDRLDTRNGVVSNEHAVVVRTVRVVPERKNELE